LHFKHSPSTAKSESQKDDIVSEEYLRETVSFNIYLSLCRKSCNQSVFLAMELKKRFQFRLLIYRLIYRSYQTPTKLQLFALKLLLPELALELDPYLALFQLSVYH
jgi:hypothetical protein